MNVSPWILIFILLLLAAGVFAVQSRRPVETDLAHVQSSQPGSKKVLLLVIDSLLTEALDEGIRQNRLPTFQYLIDRGQYYKDFVSSFPTMSISIDSTLVTGTYPDRHRVPGLIWYDAAQQALINYGTGPMEIYRQGLNPVLLSSLLDLNGRHLSPDTRTLYEDFAQQGLTSASINGMLYRGSARHQLFFPPWMSWFTALPRTAEVTGPDFLSFGAFSDPLHGLVKLPDGPTVRLGLNNRFSLGTLTYLIQQNKLPDFAYVYFPDLDKPLHKKGPSELSVVEEMDGQLRELLDAFGSPEQAGEQAAFVIMGDSGVSQIKEREEDAIIDLSGLLRGYDVLQTGHPVTAETDLVLAVNETMAYVYLLKSPPTYRELSDALLADPRMDFVAWQGAERVHVVRAGPGAELRYAPQGGLTDPYNQTWTIEGNPSVLDLDLSVPGQVGYGQYPDALQRLYSALHSHEGYKMIIAARPGCELADLSSPKHTGGGAHGSLHADETLIPLIIYGTQERPATNRIVDLKAYLMRLVQSFHGQATAAGKPEEE